MSNYNQYVYDKDLWMTGNTPNTLKSGGKYPVVADEQWSTLEDALNFINDSNSSAIPGMVITVVSDGDNNGVYFVESIGGDDTEGKLVRLSDNDDLQKLKEDLSNLKTETGEIDLSNYYTKSEIEEKKFLTDSDLTGYVKSDDVYSKSEVDDIKSEITKDNSEKIDTLKSEIETSLSDYAKKSDIPDVSKFITDSDVEKKGYLTEHQDLSEYAKLTDIPDVSNLVSNDDLEGKGYLTEHQDLTGYAKSSDIPDVSKFITDSDVEKKGYLTEHQDLSEYAKLTDIPDTYTKSEIDKIKDSITDTHSSDIERLTKQVKLNTETLSSLQGADGTLNLNNLYYTKQEILDKGYVTSSELEEKGYAKSDNVNEKFVELTGQINTLENKTSGLSDRVKKIESDYLTSTDKEDIKTWVGEQGYLTEHQDLSEYAKLTHIPNVSNLVSNDDLEEKGYLTSDDISDLAKKSDIPDVSKFITNSDVEKKGYLTEHQDLTDYAKISDIPDVSKFITDSDVEKKGYLTSDDLTGYAKSSEIPDISNLVSNDDLEGKGYLTEHQDLSEYVKKSDIDELVSNDVLDEYAKKSDIPDTSEFITDSDLTKKGYVTSDKLASDVESLTDMIADVSEDVSGLTDKIEELGGSDIATKTWVGEQGYLTEHQDLTGYAKSSDIPDVSNLVSNDDLEEKGYLTEHQDLTGYAKSSDIPDVSKFITDSDVEKKGYLTEHQDLSEYAKLSEIPDVSKFITDSDVEKKGYLTEHQDLSEYAKLTDIPDVSNLVSNDELESKGYLTEHQDLSEYAKSSEIPDVSNLVSNDELESKGYLTEHQDLSEYAKSSEIPDVSKFITDSDVEKKGYLTEHQDLSEYAKSSEIPDVSNFVSTDELSELEQKHDDDISKINTSITNITGGDLNYVSSAEDSWKTSAVGGVSANMSPSDFEGKTLSEVFDMILYPTLQPTVTQPSVTLTYSGSTLILAGQILPAINTVVTSTNRGTTTYTNKDGNKYYAGEVTTSSLTMSPDSWGVAAVEGKYVMTFSATFGDGPVLCDNKGGVSTVSSYKSGTKTTTKTISCVYPVYINSSEITTMTSMTKDYFSEVEISVTIPMETSDNKFEIQLPDSVNLVSVKQLNTLNNTYDIDVSMVNAESINNETYNKTYVRYVRTTDTKDIQGSSQYKIRIKKA